MKNAQGLIHYEYILEGHTVNKEMYIKILSGERGMKDLVSFAQQSTYISIISD
jgi:hypothetical protein